MDFTVTIDAEQVDSPLTDFPLFVDLADMPNSFWDAVSIKTDIAVEDAPCEVGLFDKNAQTGTLWIKVDLQAGSQTQITIKTDGSTSPGNVWSNGFIGVYHLNDLQFADSSSVNGSGTGSNLGSNALQSGQLGNSVYLTETAYHKYADIELPQAALTGATEGTISGWARFDNPGTDGLTLFGYRGPGSGYFELQDDGSLNWTVKPTKSNTGRTDGKASLNLAPGQWHYLCLSVDSSGHQAYVNGQPVTMSYSNGSASDSRFLSDIGAQNRFAIGSNFAGSVSYTHESDGYADEVRFSGAPRSADWIQTEYANQSNPAGFYSITEQAPELPTIQASAAATDKAPSFDVRGALKTNATADTTDTTEALSAAITGGLAATGELKGQQNPIEGASTINLASKGTLTPRKESGQLSAGLIVSGKAAARGRKGITTSEGKTSLNAQIVVESKSFKLKSTNKLNLLFTSTMQGRKEALKAQIGLFNYGMARLQATDAQELTSAESKLLLTAAQQANDNPENLLKDSKINLNGLSAASDNPGSITAASNLFNYGMLRLNVGDKPEITTSRGALSLSAAATKKGARSALSQSGKLLLEGEGFAVDSPSDLVALAGLLNYGQGQIRLNDSSADLKVDSTLYLSGKTGLKESPALLNLLSVLRSYGQLSVSLSGKPEDLQAAATLRLQSDSIIKDLPAAVHIQAGLLLALSQAISEQQLSAEAAGQLITGLAAELAGAPEGFLIGKAIVLDNHFTIKITGQRTPEGLTLSGRRSGPITIDLTKPAAEPLKGLKTPDQIIF